MAANCWVEAKWIYVFIFPVHILADFDLLPARGAISTLISIFKGL